MKQTDNYQIINVINKEKKLAAIRSEIMEMPAEKALDFILDASFPANLVQSFPDQDLHFMMYHIGKEDFIPVLSLASSQQWEYILDVEVWDNDRFNINKITNTLALLYKADPERLLRWAVKEKTEFFEHYLFKNMEIRIREHDEDPSDFGDDFVTIDSIFYFRFPEPKKNLDLNQSDDDPTDNDQMMPESLVKTEISDNDNLQEESRDDVIYDETEMEENETAEIFISNMLNTLADMDISVFQSVLLETDTIIPAEIEEEEFRLKNVRLAEKGFLPPHEAVALYQPLKPEDLKRRPTIFLSKPFVESELSYPPLYPRLLLQKKGSLKTYSLNNRKNLFAAALEYLAQDDNISINLQSELAFLVNSIVSADNKILRSREELEKNVHKTCCYLSVGIEIIHSKKKGKHIDLKPKLCASVILNYALKDIFRVGSGASLSLKKRAVNWYMQSHIRVTGLPLSFLGEKWFGIIGGLLLERPLFFNSLTDNKNSTNGDDKNRYVDIDSNSTLYRPFSSIDEIEYTSNELDEIILIDSMLKQLNFDFKTLFVDSLSLNFITWKAIFMTLWAMKRMGINSSPSDCCSIPFKKFKPFFVQLLDLKSRRESNLWNQDQPEQFENTSGQSATSGKIVEVIRNDFFNWLDESGIIKIGKLGKDIKENYSNNTDCAKDNNIDIYDINLITIHKIFNDLFDEIEEEYGSVASEDIAPELIFHFIVARERE